MWVAVVRLFILVAVAVAGTIGVRAQLDIELSRDTMDFGIIGPCETVVDSFDLVNTGTRIVPSPGRTVLPGFTIDPVSDNNIMPGERRRMYVTFTGTSAQAFYVRPHIVIFTNGSEMVADTIWLIARTEKGRCCVFAADSMEAMTGDRIVVSVRQDSTRLRADLRNVTFTMKLAWDSTILVADGRLPDEISRTKGTVIVRGSLLSGNGPVLDMPFRAVLGRAPSSPVRIVWYSLSDANVTVTSYDGVVRLMDICNDPVDRLFDPLHLLRDPVVTTRSDGRIDIDVVDAAPVPREVVVADIRGAVIATVTIPVRFAGTLTTAAVPPGPVLVRVQGHGTSSLLILP